MGNTTVTVSDEWEVPDLILRDAYKSVAMEVQEYREKFIVEERNLELVRSKLGPTYSHIRNRDLAHWIISACKNPERHGGNWSVTRSGHGASKYSDIMSQRPSWYRDEYLIGEWWQQRKRWFLEFWEYRCALCKSDKQI